MKPNQFYHPLISKILQYSWAIGFLLPFIYLWSNPAYFNKDDNFAQFTPVFKYAFDASLHGQFPWMHPGELTSRIAESPYYAIFSPILLGAYIFTTALHLQPYWIVNIWAVIYFFLINLVLLKFASRFSIPVPMRGVLVLCAGIGSYMGQFSVNWYYVLPFQLLIISKIYYWNAYLDSLQENKSDCLLLLIATYLAIYGGNPQLLFYAHLVELMCLIYFLRGQILKIYFRNQFLMILLLAPWIYCQLEYWGKAWRTIYNHGTTNIQQFVSDGIINLHQQEGQSTWIIACLFCILALFIRKKQYNRKNYFCLSLAIVSILLLLLSLLDIEGIYGEMLPILKVFTTPLKWWFFGGITSVLAVALWSKSWESEFQVYFAAFSLIGVLVYLAHNFQGGNFIWKDLDYTQAGKSIETLAKHAESNSRISQISNFRDTDPNPSAHLLLNTWLAGNFGDLVFAKGYETVQAPENLHPENNEYFKSPVLDAATFRNLGISALWVNRKEYPKSTFSPRDYQTLYEDENHYLLKLIHPGRIVDCRHSNCDASIHFFANRITLNARHFSSDDIITVKVTPYKNLSVSGDNGRIPSFVCKDGWLCFKPIKNIEAYTITYRDPLFIVLLIFSNIVFSILLILLASNYYPRINQNGF